MDLSGSPLARFRDALASGDVALVVTAARQLSRLTLADALAVCLVLRSDDEQFPRWATRWHARFVTEIGLTSSHESQLVLTALLSLADEGADAGRAVLEDVFRRHGQIGLLEELRRYDASGPAATTGG